MERIKEEKEMRRAMPTSAMTSQEMVKSLRISLGSYKPMRHCDVGKNKLILICTDLPMTTVFIYIPQENVLNIVVIRTGLG